jgi:HAD superfamily hydrolase (TIGR01509 family)
MGDGRTVIFDCDGVLVDSERIIQEVDMAMIAELGWPITREEILSQHLGRTSTEVAANIERHLGRALPPDFQTARDAAYAQAFRASLVEVPGVRSAVYELQATGWQTCVASSGSHARMRLTLGVTGLRSLFEGRIYGAEDVARGKPAPDLFLHAARDLGAIPAECVVVEDSPSGVAAARAAGMPVVGFAGLTPRAALADADVVITHMDVLVETVTDLVATD